MLPEVLQPCFEFCAELWVFGSLVSQFCQMHLDSQVYSNFLLFCINHFHIMASAKLYCGWCLAKLFQTSIKWF